MVVGAALDIHVINKVPQAGLDEFVFDVRNTSISFRNRQTAPSYPRYARRWLHLTPLDFPILRVILHARRGGK